MGILNSEQLLAANFTIPQSSTWFATTTGATPAGALQLSLPGPGTYQITVNLLSFMKVTGNGGYLLAGLFDTAAAALSSDVIGGTTYWTPNLTYALGNSIRMIWLDPSGTGNPYEQTGSFTVFYTTTEASPKVCLCVYRGDVAANTWADSIVYSAGNGYTVMSYVQLSPAPVTFENSATFNNNLTVDGLGTFGDGVQLNATSSFTTLMGATLDANYVNCLTSLTMSDLSDIVFGTVNGAKIGTGTNQKLSFYNASPIVQPSGDIPTALSNLGLIASPSFTSSVVFGGVVQFDNSVYFDGNFTIAGGVEVTLDTLYGSMIGTASNQKIGFLGATPAVQQTGGVKTAGAAYGANEQTMLQDAYNALRTFGFLS